MKRILFLLVLLVGALIIAACGSAAVEYTANANTSSAPLTVDEMQHDPMSFTNQISVIGTVGNYGRFNFSLSGENGDFELAIDYRGNQAIPEMGTTIIANGRMNYRPCCGPHLIVTSFEEAQP